MTKIAIQPLTSEAFSPFGDVIALKPEADKIINQGMCGRHHDLAAMDFSEGRAGISLFNAQPRSLPYTLEMVERHPEGSQAFIPMTEHAFLVIVAKDLGGKPDTPLAFQTQAGQAINFHRNTWHGVLTPLAAPGLFAVVDRIGDDKNLEEFWFDTPHQVVASQNQRSGIP
ncbi:ureidoglycolate lyase [uncultured Shimia sp.]|uniref:ureidoglycolate lyase n=1 Tax=uncultured Shimia sp. TaxID=573152 RepID=UPI0025E234E1|nr:ureidoglycolate lyase [uncultured Shimia sp.]